MKSKKHLSKDSDRYFKDCYAQMISGGCVGKVTSRLHSKIERMWELTALHKRNLAILEVGSGQSQHRAFVQDDFNYYVELDLFNYGNITNLDKRLVFSLGDCQNLADFETGQFDRVIATCLLVHLNKPEEALKEWRRVTKVGGVISLWVALEPSILLRLMQRISTKRKVEKLGFDYYSIHYRQHINHYPRMRQLLREVFATDQIRVSSFPFKGLSWDLNLVEIWTIKIK